MPIEAPQPHFPSCYRRPTQPPAVAKQVPMADGAEISVFVYGGEAPWSDAPETAPVVFIHGNGEEHGIFGPTIDTVAAAGNPAIALDSRAQGTSTRGTEPLSYELFERDTLAVLDALGCGCFHVVGFSDGGIVALLLARDCPARVLSCTAIGANLEPDGVLVDESWDIEGTIARLERWAAWADSLDSAKVDASILTPTAEEARNTAELLHLMEVEPHIEAASLHAISCPVTVMAGEFDAIAPEETLRIAEAIPRSRLLVLKEHGHTLPKEAPDEVTDAVLETLLASCQA